VPMLIVLLCPVRLSATSSAGRASPSTAIIG
jgi:hypothetical protein